jgi:tetratricopeptide (TPR) repeat protein
MLTSHRCAGLLGGLLLTLLTIALPGPAGAAGGGGSEGATTSAKPEDPQYTVAVKAIKANEYTKAIPLLEGVVARDDKNADAYNWLAYATRKHGNPAASLPLYQKALALDPKHKGAHEYIGEAYLMLDNLPKAKEHLRTLSSLCFITCAEYRDLKRAVDAYEKTGGKTKPTASSW